MKSVLYTASAVITMLIGFTTEARAEVLPEPGSLALTGLGLAAAIYFLRKGRK